MSTDDETSTDDGVKQRPAEEPKFPESPEIRVSTQYCMVEGCRLGEPESGPLRVRPPFEVSITNAREDCIGNNKTVWWKVASTFRFLSPGETASHAMADDVEEETLELYYENCDPVEPDSHGIPDPGTTPRVTINLIKRRDL